MTTALVPRLRRLIGALLALLCAALFLSGCASRSQAPQPAAVAVLIDVSGSTDSVKDRYLTEFDKVLSTLQGGERLFVIPISAASLVEPLWVDKTLPAKSAMETDFTHNRALKKARTDIRQQVTEFINAPRSARPGSAIIDGLEQARAALASFPAQKIIVLSDMIEQSERADFSALTEATVAPTLANLQDRVTKLAADVYVTGITDGGGEHHLPASQVLAIRSFWEQFFAARGAQVKGYGPTLLNFRTHSGA